MEIAVITFCNNGNFGSELQAVAMNDFCKKQGHHATFCIAKASNKAVRAAEMIANKGEILFHTIINKEYRRLYKQRKYNAQLQVAVTDEQKKKVLEFVNRRISVKRMLAGSIKRANFDCYICGSDQIWSASKIPFDSIRFLGGIPAFKKIAYAPSFGLNTLPEFFKKKAMKYIVDFEYLSVRELSAQKYIQEETGVIAKTVLDPTLMMGRAYWEEQVSDKGRGYCVCYFLGNISDEQAALMNRTANGKKIIVLPSALHCEKLMNAEYAISDPLDFISYIHNADIVFTDSFHGTAFSMIFEKKFITFSRTQAKAVTQTSRIFSLLEQFGLQTQFCHDAKSFCMPERIDYTKVNQTLCQKQAESIEFLTEALKAVEQYSSKKKGKQV